MVLGKQDRTNEQSPVFKLSIRTIILTVFLAQLFIVAFFTAYLTFKSNAKSALVLISNSIHELNDGILEEISDYFQPPIEINNLNEKLIRDNIIDAKNQADLIKQFSIQIQARNSVNSISFANPEGGIANAGIDKAKNKYYVIYTDNFKSGLFSKYILNEMGEKSYLAASLPDFDTRTRPWYQKAIKDSAVVWSDVYLIATGNDLGINASKAVRDENNKLIGVVCVDLFLSDISKFLSNLKLGIGGQAFIIDKSGYLIASSKNYKLFDLDSSQHIQKRLKATESESELMRSITIKLKGNNKDFSKINSDKDISYTVNGIPYFVHIKPFSVVPAHEWIIVTVIPKITFMAPVYANNHITNYLILVALLLSIVLAVFLARLISGPILKLDYKVRAISQGEWQSEPIPSRIKEIDGLAVEMYKMKTTIQSTIESLNSEVLERRQAESFLQDIIDKNPISIQIVDKDGFTVKVNEANAKLFGLAPPPEFCVFTDPQILAQGQSELLKRAKNGEVVYLPDMFYNVKLFHESFPDKPIWVKVVIFPIRDKDGKPMRFVLMHEDVTHRKLSEQALIAAKESAEENNRLKSSFLANMSHELRTPLSGILGFSELLKEQLKEEATREMAKMINLSGNRLLNTLNLILDLSQIEANMQVVHNSVFDANSLLQQIINLFEPVAAKKELSLVFEQDKPRMLILSDLNMLEHIMNELISNAIKYTLKGSVKVASGIVTEGNESWIQISVTDTGIGIPPENQEVVFDAFRQVSEGWNRSFEGTGLGLTICKKYVILLGGEIILESALGKGSKFVLRFPSDLQQTKDTDVQKITISSVSPEITHELKTSSLPNILLIDDDEMCHVLVSKMLKNTVSLDYSANGAEGLAKLSKNLYAAILLDINLKSGLSGLDVIDKIKKLKQYDNVPIIALTAYAMLDDREIFLSHGFSGYISKPFNSNDLIATLHKWLT